MIKTLSGVTNGFFEPSKAVQVVYGKLDGVLAQLVERLVRNEKVRGSNPLGSTIFWWL